MSAEKSEARLLSGVRCGSTSVSVGVLESRSLGARRSRIERQEYKAKVKEWEEKREDMKRAILEGLNEIEARAFDLWVILSWFPLSAMGPKKLI